MTGKNKKLGAIICTALIVFSLTGCAKDTRQGKEDMTADSKTIEVVEGVSLGEDTMKKSIVAYYDIYNEAFAKAGEDITVTVDFTDKGEVNIVSTQNNKKQTIFSWQSIVDAFSYLYEKEQVDLKGNVLVDVSDFI